MPLRREVLEVRRRLSVASKTYCWGDTTHPSVNLSSGTALQLAWIEVVGTQDPVPYDVCVSNVSLNAQ